MTKIKILGLDSKDNKELKPIEFVKNLRRSVYETSLSKPCTYDNIILICANFKDGLDLMCAYNDSVAHDSSNRLVVLGRFNDGVVENLTK